MIAYAINHKGYVHINYEVGKTYALNCPTEYHSINIAVQRDFDNLDRYCNFEDKKTKIFEVEVLGEVKEDEYKLLTNKIRVVREIPRSEWREISKNCVFDENQNVIYREHVHGNYSSSEKIEYENDKIVRREKTDGTATIYFYDVNWNLIREEYSNGYFLKYEYDKNNNLIREEHSSGHLRKMTYDEKNNLIKKEFDIIKGKHYWIKFEYDENKNLIREEHSSGHLRKMTYDEKNNLIKFAMMGVDWTQEEIDKKSIFSIYEYDENRNMISEFNGDDKHTVTIE